MPQLADEQARPAHGALGLDPTAATAFFRDQIAASKVAQKGLFARWTAHPEEAPITRPDLGQIRAQLDQLTAALLQQPTATVDVHTEPTSCAVRLTLAAGSAVIVQMLDALHRRALATTLRSLSTSQTVTPS
ncbi:hypothetical protein ABZU76_07615 [Amycolatopsis sp. NPDC005232]|uniref:hypothetical protein n=1 Tax=Amycolatopsis sp. NPDC005232 TaxID=3157027 RepID=UPI0033A1C7A3